MFIVISLCTLVCTWFSRWFSENYFNAQTFCHFSKIPPTWCVVEHLLRHVWLFVSECEKIGFACLWPPGGHETPFLVDFPYSAVMAAILFLQSKVLFLYEMWTIGNYIVIWLWQESIRLKVSSGFWDSSNWFTFLKFSGLQWVFSPCKWSLQFSKTALNSQWEVSSRQDKNVLLGSKFTVKVLVQKIGAVPLCHTCRWKQ